MQGQTISARESILNAAEQRIRASGYNDVSFRDLAKDVGIKSASVHYHFPRKTDLGAALIQRYAAQFEDNLALINFDPRSPASALRDFVTLYRQALVIDQSICLCAILGAEAIGLPPEIKEELRTFFSMNIAWLEKNLPDNFQESDLPQPAEIVATLEGAMIIASVMGDAGVFDTAASRVVAAYNKAFPPYPAGET